MNEQQESHRTWSCIEKYFENVIELDLEKKMRVVLNISRRNRNTVCILVKPEHHFKVGYQVPGRGNRCNYGRVANGTISNMGI